MNFSGKKFLIWFSLKTEQIYERMQTNKHRLKQKICNNEAKHKTKISQAQQNGNYMEQKPKESALR